jgi:hypothetical protein
MANFCVRIDHLSDQELSFFGWEKVQSDQEFGTYWNARYNEFQPVSETEPRYLVVDDWNDAQSMSRAGSTIIQAP